MSEAVETTCCIAGGGPAGMMLGYLLARAGIDVMVLEKHADFLRDFRGDTVHPSTLEVMHELGLLDRFLTRPHSEVREIGGQVGGELVTIADFGHLPTRCKFVALMPQWDFLDFLAEEGRRFPGFHLRMETECTGLLEENGKIVGVTATSPSGDLAIRADLVVGADGRHSAVREQAKLEVEARGVPIDVLWFRISRGPGDPAQTFGHIEAGRILVMLDRSDYWQCAFVIPKGGYDSIREHGLEAFRAEILRLSPYLADRIGEIGDWDKVKLLTVTIDRLKTWHRPGLLCIGDSAHAMSPIGGVGINLAIQDAVATANILTEKLREHRVTDADLQAVQNRRSFPTNATQMLQRVVQNRVISRVLASDRPLKLPWPLKLLRRFPILRRIPARVVGMGFRPEHVRVEARS